MDLRPWLIHALLSALKNDHMPEAYATSVRMAATCRAFSTKHCNFKTFALPVDDALSAYACSVTVALKNRSMLVNDSTTAPYVAVPEPSGLRTTLTGRSMPSNEFKSIPKPPLI